jgi:DNA gyrase subunit B/topoisomerase-4 subunit B
MVSESYTASDIVALEGLDPVRKRPAMYIGGVGKSGLHHLLWEVVDNAVDEAINGFARSIIVTIHKDGASATVSDNGRGIPVDIHPRLGKSALEVILTHLHAGGKFGGKVYETSGGLHGVGASVVNALSSSLVATVKRDNRIWQQKYAFGKPKGPVEDIGPCRGTGTTIYFRPDGHIFPSTAFDPDLIAHRLDTKAYLNAGLKIVFRDEADSSRNATFEHEGGLADLLQSRLRELGAQPVCPEFFFLKKEQDGMKLEAALCWTETPKEMVGSYVNTIPTSQGGTHEQGFRDAVVRAIRAYIDTHDLQPRGITIGAEDIREGLLGVISTFIPEPQFQGQTKEKLNNLEVRGQVDGLMRRDLEQWLHNNSSVAESIVLRVIQSAKARAASRAAAKQVRRKARTGTRLNLPGKLADCSSSHTEEREIFIVEGDSAGGSAKQGRDRRTQAVLPLWGKVLNTEQATLSKILGNKELGDVVKALGCGMADHFEIDRLRYQRVILLMDADSDGHHIATLLLTFFYRHLPKLIDAGHIYLAQPPLYRIQVGKESHWALDEPHKARILAGLRKGSKPEITRFKGLGEMMPKTLYRTTMDSTRRNLLKVVIPEGLRIETDRVMSDLMGKDPQRRFEFIMGSADMVQALDI